MFMHDPAFRSEQIFSPSLLDMDQSALPLAKR